MSLLILPAAYVVGGYESARKGLTTLIGLAIRAFCPKLYWLVTDISCYETKLAIMRMRFVPICLFLASFFQLRKS